MEVGEGVPPLSVPAGLTQVVVKGEAPQRRKLPLPSYSSFGCPQSLLPHTLPLCQNYITLSL